MSDLHERLHAAVTARLETARAATPGPWRWVGMPEPIKRVLRSDAEEICWDPTRGGSVIPSANINGADAEHIAANDPATIIRHCEADLRRLERHRSNEAESEAAGLCAHGWHDNWPCVDIRDVAAAYGIEVHDA